MARSVDPVATSILSLCRDLDVLSSHVNDAHASSFFTQFPLDALFSLMSSSTLHPPQLDLVLRVLSKILATPAGTTVLQGAGPYLDAAAQADSVPLRSLAAEQYGQMLAISQQMQPRFTAMETDTESDTALPASSATLVKLMALLGDHDPSVAAIAFRHLNTHLGSSSSTTTSNGSSGNSTTPQPSLSDSLYFALTPGSSSFCALQSVSRSEGSVVRLRVVELLLGLAGRAGPAGAERLQSSGLLRPLLRDLENTSDILSCLSALNVVQQLVEGTTSSTQPQNSTSASASPAHTTTTAPLQPLSMAAVLASLVMPQLLRLLQCPQVSLRAGALPIATALLKATLEVPACGSDSNGDAVMAENGDSASSSIGSAATAKLLLDGMRGVLDDSGNEGAETEAAVLDAIGQLGLIRAGAELVLTDADLAAAMLERALGRAGSPDVRVAALHATASCAGLDRANESRLTSAAILSPKAEALLRTSLYVACGRRTPAEVILPLLQQPFIALRCATYRLASSLSLRAWFAAELARSEPLMTHLLRGGETGADGAHWRHACILAMQSTTKRAAARVSCNAHPSIGNGHHIGSSSGARTQMNGRVGVQISDNDSMQVEVNGGDGQAAAAVSRQEEEDAQYDGALVAVAEAVAAAATAGPFSRNEEERGRGGRAEAQPVVATARS